MIEQIPLPANGGLRRTWISSSLARPSTPAPDRSIRLGAGQHARPVFGRALARKSLPMAIAACREMGVIGLDEALALLVLVAEVEPRRLDAYARRWIGRLVAERELTLGELDLAVTTLRTLPSRRAEDALRALIR